MKFAFRQRSSSAGVVIHGTFRALATTPFFIRHFERAGFVTDVGATTASEALRNHIAGGSRMSNNALRTARKVWKQIKYNLEDRSALELGSADDDAEQIKEIDADQSKDIEKAINDAIRTLMATGSWPAGQRDP